jgi:plasmid stability protein
MGMMTVRHIPDEVHDALRAQAKTHGRSTEAEVRAILADAVKPETRIQMGDALAALGRRIGLTDEDFAVLEQRRDKTPAEPMRFE